MLIALAVVTGDLPIKLQNAHHCFLQEDDRHAFLFVLDFSKRTYAAYPVCASRPTRVQDDTINFTAAIEYRTRYAAWPRDGAAFALIYRVSHFKTLPPMAALREARLHTCRSYLHFFSLIIWLMRERWAPRLKRANG